MGPLLGMVSSIVGLFVLWAQKSVGDPNGRGALGKAAQQRAGATAVSGAGAHQGPQDGVAAGHDELDRGTFCFVRATFSERSQWRSCTGQGSTTAR